MTTLPATKVRQQFFKLLESAGHPGSFVTITVDGEPKVVMMSAEDFEGWQETLEIMSDKKLSKSIEKDLKSWKKEKLVSEEEVKKRLKL